MSYCEWFMEHYSELASSFEGPVTNFADYAYTEYARRVLDV